MSDARKVYILTQGEYSDYHIVGVFSTEEAAQGTVAEMEKSQAMTDSSIEEYPLDDLVPWRLGLVYAVYISIADGSLIREFIQEDFRHPEAAVTTINLNNILVRSPVSRNHAMKVAVEERQRWLREASSP